MKKSTIFGLIIIAAAVCLIIALVGDFSSYETFETASKQTGKEIHVIGVLEKDKAMEYDPLKDANYFSFFAKDQKGEIRQVVYNDSKPQDFEKSEQLVMVGKMDGEVFKCSEILMKCPSKYQGNGGPADNDGFVSSKAPQPM